MTDDNAAIMERLRQGLLEEYFAEIIILKSRIEELTAALHYAAGRLSDLDYHWLGDKDALWQPIRAALKERK